MGRGSVVTSELGLEVLNWAQNEGGRDRIEKSRFGARRPRRPQELPAASPNRRLLLPALKPIIDVVSNSCFIPFR